LLVGIPVIRGKFSEISRDAISALQAEAVFVPGLGVVLIRGHLQLSRAIGCALQHAIAGFQLKALFRLDEGVSLVRRKLEQDGSLDWIVRNF
jgi:hypothetical protein